MQAAAWVAKGVRRLAAALVLVGVGYGAAGMVGGAIPVNAGWRPPASGVTIWVETNGIHTDLLLPKVAAGVDWRPLARARDLADPRFAAYDHLAIGWGEQRFFLDTPRWRDARPAPLLLAAIGSDATLIHVEHVPAPHAASDDVRRIVLRPAEYRRLAAFIRASWVIGGRRHRGYGGFDAFYQARGHYDAATTCNAWTGRALAAAGVRVGRWTPFPVTVMGWFGQ